MGHNSKILLIIILDLFVVYFFVNFSIGSLEDQFRYYNDAPLKIISMRFLFSWICSNCLTTPFWACCYAMWRILQKEIGVPDRECKKNYSCVFLKLLKNNIYIITIEVIILLLVKFIECGYV